MNEMNIFEAASRAKLKFTTARGVLLVEQLWDLPLKDRSTTSLDDIAKELDTQIRNTTQKSFVDDDDAECVADAKLKLAFDVVMHVIKSKKAQIALDEAALEKAQKIATLEAAIAADEQKQLVKGGADKLRKKLEEIKAS